MVPRYERSVAKDGGEEDLKRMQIEVLARQGEEVCPTNNAFLINLRLISDAEILLISTDRAHKSAPNVQKRADMQCLRIPN